MSVSVSKSSPFPLPPTSDIPLDCVNYCCSTHNDCSFMTCYKSYVSADLFRSAAQYSTVR
jgi:hypothetical protein